MNIKFENLGTVNTNKVSICELDIYFSYETPVAFQAYGEKMVCRENSWSTTTGKFLNSLQPDKTKRIEGRLFDEKLQQAITGEMIRWNKCDFPK